MRPFFGIEPVLVDAQGQVLKGNGVSGNLCLKQIPPGMSRTVYGDHERFKEVYYKDFPGLYFTGDGARRDEDGHYWITGRVDDVINVAGHRLGVFLFSFILVLLFNGTLVVVLWLCNCANVLWHA